MRSLRWMAGTAVMAGLLGGIAGCPTSDNIVSVLDALDELEIEINQNVNQVQTVVPTDFPDVLIQDRGPDVIVIADDATIVTNIQQTIIIEELPDITLVGLENLTSLDAYYQYLVDGEFQGVFVFSGETLLIEYPCLLDIEIISEDYFDPFTGELIDSFELDGAVFFNPDDFECGDAFIVSFGEDDIVVDNVAIDLLD